ncbi:hypothetical protein [Kiloniella litopenaei]|uniref:hypothetical protein n=1 Tax=Kiloniella litopenaei TaxID=1549748 RepID=UPI000DE5BE01|nr:hypothetical protein [Kiloniella litopenaei]
MAKIIGNNEVLGGRNDTNKNNIKRLVLLCLSSYVIYLSSPVNACIISARMVMEDVKYAEAVVVGKVINYEIVKDKNFRKLTIAALEKQTGLSEKERAEKRSTIEQRSFITDYARFDIDVREVLLGNVSDTITVTWNNSTFGEPDNLSDFLYLIALSNPVDTHPPLRGPSATIPPSVEPNLMTVLQAPCSSAFIFENSSQNATKIRQIIKSIQE